MPFITQGKTNWKFLLIVIILAIIVGGGVLWLSVKQKVSPPQLPEIKKPEQKNIEVTTELANKIMDKVVPADYNRKTACFINYDFDSNNLNDILIAALKPIPGETYGGDGAYLVVVKPIDNSGNYEKIADITLENFPFFTNAFCDDQYLYGIPSFLDLDKDGNKEMILNVEQMADGPGSFGVFKINTATNKIEWLQIKNKDGKLENIKFDNVDVGGFAHIFEVKDLNSDGITELIREEINCNGVHIGGNCNFNTVQVYKWDGSGFSYNEELSRLLQNNLTLLDINRQYINITP